MKVFILCGLMLSAIVGHAQKKVLDPESFCQTLYQIMEDGREENFEAVKTIITVQSPMIPYHGDNLKLQGFPIMYVDKDWRFVAKTNLNMDSLSAVAKLDECKKIVVACLDSAQWDKWSERTGDDSTTVFFKELRELRTTGKSLELTLAMIELAVKEYSVVMYIKRHK